MDITLGKRVTTDYTVTITSSPDYIFPLLCPVEELKWIPGWKYDLIYSESGKNENNCIFAEYMTGPHFLGNKKIERTLWTTTQHDTINHIIHFLIVNAFLHIKLEVELMPDGKDKTNIKWTMIATSVNEQINSLMNEEMINKMNFMLKLLSDLLKKYCDSNISKF